MGAINRAPTNVLAGIVDNAVDHATFVVTDVECAIWPYSQADGTAGSIVVINEPARGKVLRGASDLAIDVQGDEDDFVTSGHAAVP